MTMTIEERNREQNGRFAQELRTEAGPLQTEGMTATFCFPPRLASADEMVAFFERAEIPEIVLSNTRFAYTDFRREQVDKKTEEWADTWEHSPEFKEFKRQKIAEGVDQDMFQFEANLEMRTQRALLEAELPMDLPISQVETIARYGQLHSRAAVLPADQAKIVGDHEVEWAPGNTKTVAEIAEYFQTDLWIRDAATTSDLQVARTSQRSAEMIVKALSKLER